MLFGGCRFPPLSNPRPPLVDTAIEFARKEDRRTERACRAFHAGRTSDQHPDALHEARKLFASPVLADLHRHQHRLPRIMTPGIAYQVRPDAMITHSNIMNVGTQHAKFLYFVSVR